MTYPCRNEGRQPDICRVNGAHSIRYCNKTHAEDEMIYRSYSFEKILDGGFFGDVHHLCAHLVSAAQAFRRCADLTVVGRRNGDNGTFCERCASYAKAKSGRPSNDEDMFSSQRCHYTKSANES